MAFGRKKESKPKTITIKSPPPLTYAEYLDPLGNRFITETQGNQLFTRQLLTPESSALLASAQQGLQQTLQEASDSQSREDALSRESTRAFQVRSGEINAQADTLESRARQSLSRRFGNSLASTFGANFLATLSQNRLQALSEARVQSEDDALKSYDAQQRQRMNRYGLFASVIDGLSGNASQAGGLGVNPIVQDRNRESQLAVERANLLARVQQGELASSQNIMQQRLGLVQNLGFSLGRMF